MATLQQQAIHWRDRAIARSEAISDAWQVFLAYTGRAAEIILFICMVFSLLQMLPTITLWTWLVNTILVIQMVTLDVAGFGLNSMAKAVRRGGDTATAEKAEQTATFLIIIMIVSLLSVTIAQMFGKKYPIVGDIMHYLDYGLILTRVVMTVLYGKVIHALRDSQQQMQAVADETEARLREELAQTREKLQQEREAVLAMKAGKESTTTDLSRQLAEMKSALDSKTVELSHTQELLQNASQNASTFQSSMAEKELALQAKMQSAMKAARDETATQMKASYLAELQAMQTKFDDQARVNAELKAQMREQAKAPTKPAKQVTPEKFDTRSFVFSCLQKSPDMKLSEIVQLAKRQGQELSEPTISRYRKEYRESSGESATQSV